jgi:hypothetical protein
MSRRRIVVGLALAAWLGAVVAQAREPDPPESALVLAKAVVALSRNGEELDPQALERALQLPGLVEGFRANEKPDRNDSEGRHRSTSYGTEASSLGIEGIGINGWGAIDFGSGKPVWYSALNLHVRRDACPTDAMFSQALGREVHQAEGAIDLDEHSSPITYIGFGVPTPGMQRALVTVDLTAGCWIMVTRQHD